MTQKAAYCPANAWFDITEVELPLGYALPDLQSGSLIGGFLIRV